MPTVLITGISGFLAAHIAHTFLLQGWVVRGTLRSDAKIASFDTTILAPYIKRDQLKLVVTGPLESADYSEAIRGVDAVVHTASPINFNPHHFEEEHLKPAEQGTRGVLEAAAKEASVKSVVVTSSYGAVGDHHQLPTDQVGRVLTEDDWNPYTKEELIKIGNENGAGEAWPVGVLYYNASKKFAELAAYDVQKQSGNKWSLATLACVAMWGPSINPLTSLSNGGFSVPFLYSIIGSGPDAKGTINKTLVPYYVDVRDAAQAHYEAVVRQANGRFIISAGPFDWQEFADMLPDLVPATRGRVPEGHPGKYDYKDPGVYDLKNDKSVRELGITYRPKAETVKDAYERILELEAQGLR